MILGRRTSGHDHALDRCPNTGNANFVTTQQIQNGSRTYWQRPAYEKYQSNNCDYHSNTNLGNAGNTISITYIFGSTWMKFKSDIDIDFGDRIKP
jgi:hypothetical protein